MGIAGFVKPFVFADDFPKVSGADLDLSEMSRQLIHGDFSPLPLGIAHNGTANDFTYRPFLLA
jgi:hypothetical protein